MTKSGEHLVIGGSGNVEIPEQNASMGNAAGDVRPVPPGRAGNARHIAKLAAAGKAWGRGGNGPTRRVFVPFHYGHGSQAANQHTWYARDPVSQQPHLKSSPVAVRRLSFGEPEPWLLERLKELDGTSIVPFAARELDGTGNRVPARVE